MHSHCGSAREVVVRGRVGWLRVIVALMARRQTFLEPQTENLLRRFALGVVGIVLSINNTSLLTTWDDDRQDRLQWQGPPPCGWSRRNEAEMLALHDCTEHWNEAGMREHPLDSGRAEGPRTCSTPTRSLLPLKHPLCPSESPSPSPSLSPSSSLPLSLPL